MFNGNCYSHTESPYLEIHKRAVVNDTLNVGERARLNCLNELLQGTTDKQIEEVSWLKVIFVLLLPFFHFSRNNIRNIKVVYLYFISEWKTIFYRI